MEKARNSHSPAAFSLPPFSGRFAPIRYSTIAYAGQQPWLLNGTIRDNILFGESYRPRRYEKIIETCALKSDLEMMPNGDLTQVGERGLSLSGGQRMRVSIARAVYSSANVIVLVRRRLDLTFSVEC